MLVIVLSLTLQLGKNIHIIYMFFFGINCYVKAFR